MCLYANWGLVFKGLHVMPVAQNTGLKWWALKRAIQCSPAICCLPLGTHYRTFWCFGFWGVLFGQQPLNQMPFASGEPVRGTLPQTILLMGWVGHASPIHCYKLVIFVIEAIHLPFILCSCPYCYGPEPFLAAEGIKRKGQKELHLQGVQVHCQDWCSHLSFLPQSHTDEVFHACPWVSGSDLGGDSSADLEDDGTVSRD